MTYRTGFEPDKSTRGWLGRRVRNLPESGGWDGEEGVVIEEECRGNEFGWFKMLFDKEFIRSVYPNGILMHSMEVELI